MGADFLNNFFIFLLTVDGSVEFILLTPAIGCSHPACEPEGQLGVLPSLRDTNFKLITTHSSNQGSSLRCAYNWVSGKVCVPGALMIVTTLAGLRFPEGDVKSDRTLMLSFQIIQDPGIPEGASPISAASFSELLMVPL